MKLQPQKERMHAFVLIPKVLAKRSQYANATYCNIVGRNMLCAFAHHVAMCCDMCVVGLSLKMVHMSVRKLTIKISQ